MSSLQIVPLVEVVSTSKSGELFFYIATKVVSEEVTRRFALFFSFSVRTHSISPLRELRVFIKQTRSVAAIALTFSQIIEEILIRFVIRRGPADAEVGWVTSVEV